MSFSSSLNAQLDVQEVIRECGTSVNSELPAYFPCPLCGSGMYAARLPGDGGGWFQCSRCDLTGDSLTLLSRFHGVDLREFLHSRTMMNADVYTPEAISEHLSISNARKEAAAGWAKFSTQRKYQELTDFRLRDVLAQTKLLNSFCSPNWKRGSGLMFGVATNAEMAEHFPVNPAGRMSDPWLISPIFSAPGCIAGVSVTDGDKHHHEAWFSHPADGLTFLFKPIRGKYVVGSRSHPHVAAIHILAQNGQDLIPPPIVGYSPGTNEAWRHVSPDIAIVLWEPKMSPDSFTMAQRLSEQGREVLIARAPVEYDRDNRPAADLFMGRSASQVMNIITTSGQPWLAAFKDYMIAKSNDHETKKRLPEQLKLNHNQIEKIKSMCRNEDELRIFTAIYNSGAIDISIRLPSGKTIIQRPNGWFKVMARGEPSLMTNAIPVIETVISYPDHRVFSGTVRVVHDDPGRTKTATFRIREEEFTTAWLKSYCERATQEFVHVTPTLEKDLYDLTTRMHEPGLALGATKLGWDDESNTFIMPKITYHRHEEPKRERRLIQIPHPYEKIPDLSEIPMAEDVVKDVSAPIWSIFLLGLHNTLAPVFGRDPVPALVECDTARDAAKLARNVAKYLWLPCAPSPSFSSLVDHLKTHDLPVFCNLESASGLNACVRHELSYKTIAVTHAGLDSELPDLLGWGRIKAPEGALEWPCMQFVLPLILDFMFSRDWTPPAEDNPLLWSADLVKRWMRFALETQYEFSNDVVAGWQAPRPAGERMVALINSLIQNKYLGLKQQKMAVDVDQNAAVRTDSELIVPVRGLRRAAAEAEIELPSNDKITQRLRQSGKLVNEISRLGQLLGWELTPDS